MTNLVGKLQIVLVLQFPEELNYLKSLAEDKLHPVLITGPNINWTKY